MENPIQKQKRQKRNEEIVKLYPEKTLMEIAKVYNLTKQRIHQIVVKEVKAEKQTINIKK